MRLVVSSKEFAIFVDAILNVDRNGASFKIHNDHIECIAMSEDNSSIFFYAKINILNAEENKISNPETIYVRDLTQFKKLLDINKTDTFTFIVQDDHIYYENDKIKKAKFMLGEKSFRDINAKVTPEWFDSFDKNMRMKINKATIKDILKASSFASSEVDRIYFYQDGKNVVAEINDRNLEKVDNISLYIGESESGCIEDKIIILTTSLAKIHLTDDMIMESSYKIVGSRKVELLFLTIADENLLIKYLLNTQTK